MQISKTILTLKKQLGSYEKTTLNREAKNYTPFKTLISCILSLRAKDEMTEKVSKKLFDVADTPEEIVKIGQKRLEKLIFSSGHYKKKARTIKHISQVLIEEHGGEVPDTEEELLKIKGIGRKTANIVLCLAYGKDVIPVDVHRIPNRLGWIKTKTPEQTEIELMKILPKKYWGEFNGLFVLFGREVCLPVSPKCSECLISGDCKRVGVGRSR